MIKWGERDPIEERLVNMPTRLTLYRACKLIYPVAVWMEIRPQRVEEIAFAAHGKGTVKPEDVNKLIDALRRLGVWESKPADVRRLARVMADALESWWGEAIITRKLEISENNKKRYTENHAQIMEQRRKKRLGLPD